jgi:hypothetical protein
MCGDWPIFTMKKTKKKSPRSRKAALILYDETAPCADRLRAMILSSSIDVDRSMREEIVRALKSIQAKTLNEALQRSGAPVALNTLKAAALAIELIRTHRIKPERSAITAAAETIRMLFSANEVTDGAVARACRKLKRSPGCSMTTGSGEKYQVAFIDTGVIDYALERRRAHKAAAGNPLFAASGRLLLY